MHTQLAILLAQAARQRCDQYVVSSLEDMFSDVQAFLELPPAVLPLLARHRKAAAQMLDRWAREAQGEPERQPVIAFMVYQMRRFLKNNHQFLSLTLAQRHELALLYHELLVTAAQVLAAAPAQSLHAPFQTVIAQHRERLRVWVAGCGLMPQAQAVARPICWEYTPELQCAVLDLDVGTLAGPLIDLGCGEAAYLPRYLRHCGVDAWGLDAFAPSGEPYLLRGDWLTHPFGKNRWGTILSHMAFSLHFLHHHLAGDARSLVYARRFMDLLESLTHGGCFSYAPGLPFFEDVLPADRFRVERQPIAGVQETPLAYALARQLGSRTLYRTCVQRLC